jgi:hypothetical protein
VTLDEMVTFQTNSMRSTRDADLAVKEEHLRVGIFVQLVAAALSCPADMQVRLRHAY